MASQRTLACIFTAALASMALAQSPLTTTFVNNNGGAAGGTVFFDLTATTGVTVLSLDVNLTSVATTAGAITVYTCPTSYVGSTGNASAWTLVASGACTAAGVGAPSSVALSPFALAAGSYGVCFVATNLAFAYTNGTGSNQVYSTTELTLSAGAAGNAAWPAAPFTPRVVNCSLGYSNGTSGTVATKTEYGTGCVARAASFYEHFTSTPAIDLSNSALRMLYTGSGYVVLPSTASFIAPSATATNLQLGDDTSTNVTLSSSFSYPGGSTASLAVCSNGFVSAGTGNGTGYQPATGAFLNRPDAAWNVWHDFYPSATGNVWFEEVAGVACITWNGVVGYNGTAAGTTPSTFQFQFELATGHVDFVFQSLDTISVSGWAGAEGWIVGYSPGGASRDAGSVDLSVVLPSTISLDGADTNPLTLSAAARPLVNTTLAMHTDNIPTSAPFGAILLGFVQLNPGISLSSMGMPGCEQYNEGAASILFLPLGSPTATVNLSIPAAVGLSIYAQSAVFAPGAALTPLGAITSQGVALRIGDI